MAALKVLQAYLVESGVPPTVQPDFDGLFRTDCAYVVLAAGADSKNRLFLWTGEGSSKKTRHRATKHATELVTTLDAGEVAREHHGQESAEFKQLWFSVRYVEGVAGGESSQDEGEAAPAEAAPAVAPQVEAAAVEQVQQKEPAQAAAIEQVQQKEPAHAAAVKVAEASPAKAASPVEAATLATAASPTKPASPAPAASPAKPSSSPATSLASAASPAKPASTAKDEVGSGAQAVPPPVKAGPASAAESKSPKVGETEGVAKARQLLTKHLSGTFVDPLHLKKGSPGSSPTAGAATNFLADSAKVWGGPAGVPPVVPDVKYKPLKDTFPYDQLKGMRSDSGIDMARKEDYLSEEEFVKVFGKDRATFKAQPAWRQQMAKKAAHLF